MAEAGHNSELTDVERKALAFDHFRKIQAQKAKVDEQQAAYKQLRKLAKADGIILGDIDFMMKCADVDDASIIPDELKRRMEIASWFALPINFQPDFFPDRAPLDERAYNEGAAASAQGKSAEPPYGADAKAGQEWMKGWHDDQKRAREALQSAMEKKNAELNGGTEPDGDPDFDEEHQEAAE